MDHIIREVEQGHITFTNGKGGHKQLSSARHCSQGLIRARRQFTPKDQLIALLLIAVSSECACVDHFQQVEILVLDRAWFAAVNVHCKQTAAAWRHFQAVFSRHERESCKARHGKTLTALIHGHRVFTAKQQWFSFQIHDLEGDFGVGLHRVNEVENGRPIDFECVEYG